jgi:type I restriction enzyme, R subunit
VIEPRRFYESPFTDLSPQGPDALFESGDVDRLLDVVAEVPPAGRGGMSER